MPGIDHEILLSILARSIKDPSLLALLRTIVESGAGLYQAGGVAEFLGLENGFPPPACGLPIGNLTSQWWGNLYLDGLDHFVKRELKIPHFQRYMDDFTLFDDSAARLVEARNTVEEWLWSRRRLRLKDSSATPRPAEGRFTYLGYRVSRAGVQAPQPLLRRMGQRLMKVVLEGDVERIERSIASYQGIVTFGSLGRRT